MSSKTAGLVVAVVIALVVGIAAGYIVGHSKAPTTQTAASGEVKVIKLGALLPLTGALSSFGENDKAALEIAEEDINTFFNKTGLPYQVEIVFEDTETKPDVALQKLQSLYSQGIKFVIGPMSSAELRNLKGYADSNKIILVSQSSTSPALSIPGDYVFRLVPDDTFQGKVIAEVLKERGVKHVVIIWRGDDWGDGLKDSIKKNCEKQGIEVEEGVRYSPETKEFSTEANRLASIVQQLVSKYGADSVGVVIISFTEGVQIMSQASKYDVLSEVKWFGSDGLAKCVELVKDPVAAEFAAKTKFCTPIAAATKSAKYENVKERVVAKLGREPEPYAYNSYDAAWILTLSIIVAGDYNPEKVKSVLPEIANSYFGASGWTKLNEAGDRASATYEIFGVEKVGGEYKWVEIGYYDAATEKFTPITS